MGLYSGLACILSSGAYHSNMAKHHCKPIQPSYMTCACFSFLQRHLQTSVEFSLQTCPFKSGRKDFCYHKKGRLDSLGLYSSTFYLLFVWQFLQWLQPSLTMPALQLRYLGWRMFVHASVKACILLQAGSSLLLIPPDTHPTRCLLFPAGFCDSGDLLE